MALQLGQRAWNPNDPKAPRFTFRQNDCSRYLQPFTHLNSGPNVWGEISFPWYHEKEQLERHPDWRISNMHGGGDVMNPNIVDKGDRYQLDEVFGHGTNQRRIRWEKALNNNNIQEFRRELESKRTTTYNAAQVELKQPIRNHLDYYTGRYDRTKRSLPDFFGTTRS